jgi:hypothetical protein
LEYKDFEIIRADMIVGALMKNISFNWTMPDTLAWELLLCS